MLWLVMAVLSAIFAGLTAVLAKCGIKKTDSDIATALRTIVVLIFSWIMVFIVDLLIQSCRLMINRYIYIGIPLREECSFLKGFYCTLHNGFFIIKGNRTYLQNIPLWSRIMLNHKIRSV